MDDNQHFELYSEADRKLNYCLEQGYNVLLGMSANTNHLIITFWSGLYRQFYIEHKAVTKTSSDKLVLIGLPSAEKDITGIKIRVSQSLSWPLFQSVHQSVTLN